jgi:integrase
MASVRKRTWSSKGRERTAWVVDYFDQAGKRRLKTLPTKKAAEDWSVTARHEVRSGIHSPTSISITVSRAGELWINHCRDEGLEKSTVRQRVQHTKLHIDPFLGRERLCDLTTPRIYQFDGELRDAGRSSAMRRKVLTNLKTILSFCQRQGLVAQNVALSVKLKGESGRDAKGPLRSGVDFPSRSELKTMMETAEGRWRPFLVTAIFTGMRASELRGLAWSNLDLDAGIVHVRQRADAWGTIGPPKSKAGKRDIPLPPMAINTLLQWKKSCPSSKLDLVFPNGRGNVESLTNIWNRFWGPLQLKCGASIETEKFDSERKLIREPRYGFHMLRHAAASLFIAHLGWTPKRLQSVMGHSSINMTFDLYGHLYDDTDADREAMKKIESAINAA